MGATCCLSDHRPVLQVKVKAVKGMRALDDDGESDCYVRIKYGDVESTGGRYDVVKTRSVKTKRGRATLDEKLEFSTGGPSTRQSLELQIMDKDMLKADDEGGVVTVYYSHHASNPEVDGDLSVSASKSSVGSYGRKRAIYFLPREWNAYHTYELETYRSDGTRGGTMTVKIAFWDKKGRIISGEDRNDPVSDGPQSSDDEETAFL